MMRCSRPSVVLARPGCTRQSHSLSSSVIFDHDNNFDNDDDVHEKEDNCERNDDNDDDDAIQMETPGALSEDAAAALTLILLFQQIFSLKIFSPFNNFADFGPARNFLSSFKVLSDLRSFGCIQRNGPILGPDL